VNITCYRGRTRYLPTLPWVTKPAYGPKRFYFYGLFESDQTGAPFAVRSRAGGSTDAYASAVGRWLVTRDGFDFLAYYLSDFDYSSHVHGPDGAEDVALARTDAAVQSLLDAAGGGDAFLERYAVVLLSDHGQTTVERTAQLQAPFGGLEHDVVVTASNRSGQLYLRRTALVDAGTLAERLDGEQSVEVTLRREGEEAVARRAGEELRFRPDGDGWATAGDAAILDRARTIVGSAREPERRRAARLGRGRLGVHRPRRAASRGRRQPRVARGRRLERSPAHDRRGRGHPPHHGRHPRRARVLRGGCHGRCSLSVRRWSSASCARAASRTSACSRR